MRQARHASHRRSDQHVDSLFGPTSGWFAARQWSALQRATNSFASSTTGKFIGLLAVPVLTYLSVAFYRNSGGGSGLTLFTQFFELVAAGALGYGTSRHVTRAGLMTIGFARYIRIGLLVNLVCLWGLGLLIVGFSATHI